MPPDMREVKCEAARGVIEALNAVEVLHVGGLAFDQWHRWGTRRADDLQLLIRDEQLRAFRDAMESAEYRLVEYNPSTGLVSDAPPDVVRRTLNRPTSPDVDYVHERYVGRIAEPELLWIRFHTTKRHGGLLLADLDNWFRGYGQLASVPVMEGPHPATEVKRPPLWAMLLWQAAEVTCAAADCAITEEDVDKLRLIAAEMSEDDWNSAEAGARRYDDEYLARIGRAPAADMVAEYAQACQVPVGRLIGPDADLEYGVLYELRYALEALEACHPHATIPGSIMDLARTTGTGGRPRKIWGYPDPEWQDRYGLEGSGGGKLGRAQISIAEQIRRYAHLGGLGLFARRLVTTDIADAPPHGPWNQCTAQQLEDIFG